MDAITFLRNKGILGEIHTKWMITFSDGIQVDLVQLFDEFAALRQQNVVGQREQVLNFPCMDDNQQCTEQCDICRFIENGLKRQ